MPPAAAEAAQDDISDHQHHQHNQLPYDSDEEEAGYQAMMSDLPAIVTISGLLDGDFDELDEIKNLLAPVSDDDDEAAAIIASKEAEDAKKISSSSTTNSYAFQVPNPIPDRVPNPIPAWSTSNSSAPPTTNSNNNKRFRQEKAAISSNKKSKLVKFKTPANVPTTAIGIPNPLLFAESSQLQPPATTTRSNSTNSGANSSQQNATENDKKVDNPFQKDYPEKATTFKDNGLNLDAAAKTAMEVKAKNAKRQEQKDAKKGTELKKPKVVHDSPKRDLVATKKPTSIKNCLIKIPNSYPVPPLPAEPVHKRAPLCKVTFRAKMEATIANTEAAIAKVEAPRLKAAQAQTLTSKTEKPTVKVNKTTNRHAATASTATKKQQQQQPPKKTNKKATAVKAKCSVVKSSIDAKKVPAMASNKAIPPNEKPKDEKEEIKSTEKFLVANPLANVPRDPPKPVPSSSVIAAATGKKTSSTSPALPSTNPVPDPTEQQEQQPPAKPETKASNRSRTPAERAKACRDRNRQHAKNTRLRKKAYVEELKRSLVDMAEERDKLLAQTQQKLQAKEARKQMMQEFLQLRGRSVCEKQELVALVHDPKTFTLTLPVTKFQTMVERNSGNTITEQVLVGVQDVIEDAGYFATFLQSLGAKDVQDNGENAPVHMKYDFDDNQFFLADGSTGILNWYATTCGAVSQGAKAELSLCGTFRAQFSPVTNKLVSGILMFDTRPITTQLSCL